MARFSKQKCYRRGEQYRCTHHTAIASFLEDTGWILEGEEAKIAEPQPLPEVAVEAGGDAFDMESKVEEPSEVLGEMTKAELLDYAMERGHDLKSSLPKAEILAACREIQEQG